MRWFVTLCLFGVGFSPHLYASDTIKLDPSEGATVSFRTSVPVVGKIDLKQLAEMYGPSDADLAELRALMKKMADFENSADRHFKNEAGFRDEVNRLLAELMKKKAQAEDAEAKAQADRRSAAIVFNEINDKINELEQRRKQLEASPKDLDIKVSVGVEPPR